MEKGLLTEQGKVGEFSSPSFQLGELGFLFLIYICPDKAPPLPPKSGSRELVQGTEPEPCSHQAVGWRGVGGRPRSDEFCLPWAASSHRGTRAPHSWLETPSGPGAQV